MRAFRAPGGHRGFRDGMLVGGGGGGSITSITSTGGTVTITNPSGPVVNLETAGGGASTLAVSYALGLAGTPAVDNAFLSVSSTAGTAAKVRWKRSHGGAIVQAGDHLGQMPFSPYNGAAFVETAALGAFVTKGSTPAVGSVFTTVYIDNRVTGVLSDPGNSSSRIAWQLHPVTPSTWEGGGGSISLLDFPGNTTWASLLIPGGSNEVGGYCLYSAATTGPLSPIITQYRPNSAGTKTYCGDIGFAHETATPGGNDPDHEYGYQSMSLINDGVAQTIMTTHSFYPAQVGITRTCLSKGNSIHPGIGFINGDQGSGFWSAAGASVFDDIHLSIGNGVASNSAFNFITTGTATHYNRYIRILSEDTDGECGVVLRTGALTGVLYDPNFGAVYLDAPGTSPAVGRVGAQLTTATTGFWARNSMAGPPTGAPAFIMTGKVPTTIDTTNQRDYARIGGAWHFSTYMDYDPTATRIPFGGGTAHTLTDNANLTYSGFNIQLGSTAAQQEVVQTGNQSLFVGTGSGNATGHAYIGTGHTARIDVSPAGNVTVKGSGAAVAGGTVGDLVWDQSTGIMTIGAAGSPPSVGAIVIHQSTSSGAPIGSGRTVGLAVFDSGGGGEASIAVDNHFYGQDVIGWSRGTGLQDLALIVGAGNNLELGYDGDMLGTHSVALAVNGTSGAISIATDLTVASATFARFGAGGASLLVNANLALQYTGGGGGDALTVADTDGSIDVNTTMSFNAPPELVQTQATGAQALTLGNGPTATGGGAADIYFKVMQGGNTYVVPGWQI